MFWRRKKNKLTTTEKLQLYRKIIESSNSPYKQRLEFENNWQHNIRNIQEPNVIYAKSKVEPNKKNIFDDIVGYEKVKYAIKTMLMNNSPVSILLDGSPGTGKSMFLHDINKFYPHNSVYVNGSKVTKAGLFKILFEDEHNNIRFLLINELDKVDYDTQETLLDLAEEGILSETMKTDIRRKKYENISIFATSNDIENILVPLQTRFFKIRIKPYTKEQFTDIGRKVLADKQLSQKVINHIIKKVLEEKQEPNIRDCIQIAKLCNNDVEIVDTLIELSDYDE